MNMRTRISMVSLPEQQRGVTLVIGLIMLALFTLIISSAFMFGNSDLKLAQNKQARDEVIAATNKALSVVMSGSFSSNPVQQTIQVDMNNDGVSEYSVFVQKPVCSKATLIPVTGTASQIGSNANQGLQSFINSYSTLWDITAVTTDKLTGATVTINTGVTVVMDQATCNANCPNTGGTPTTCS